MAESPVARSMAYPVASPKHLFPPDAKVTQRQAPPGEGRASRIAALRLVRLARAEGTRAENRGQSLESVSENEKSRHAADGIHAASMLFEEWLSGPVDAARMATLQIAFGVKGNRQVPRAWPIAPRNEEFAAQRGHYIASGSLGTHWVPPEAPTRRSTNGGSKTLRPTASDPFGSPVPTAAPTATTPAPHAASAWSWDGMVESCKSLQEWCAELTC
ncbi:hypothetical protein T484DRAFT_1848526 [Baffinella frigidus]|nr:hypothetical protein T484DRAFT_1848526 [Cryptophyta sp. CCMP2293]